MCVTVVNLFVYFNKCATSGVCNTRNLHFFFLSLRETTLFLVAGFDLTWIRPTRYLGRPRRLQNAKIAKAHAPRARSSYTIFWVYVNNNNRRAIKRFINLIFLEIILATSWLGHIVIYLALDLFINFLSMESHARMGWVKFIITSFSYSVLYTFDVMSNKI